MYLTSVEDSIAGGSERLDYGAVFIQWQIQVVSGCLKERLEDSPTKPFYRHPHSNISPNSPTWWAITDDSDEEWDTFQDCRSRWDFVDGFPHLTEFYACPSFMWAPSPANFPAPKFGLGKGTVTSRAVSTLARINPISVESASFNATRPRISRESWATATYSTKASYLVSQNPLRTGIRRKLKLLPRSKPAPVVITNTTA